MTGHATERTAAPSELAFLQEKLENAPTTGRRWKQGAENALVLWATSLLGLVVIWLVLAWLARKLLDVDYGLRSPLSPWIWIVAIALCATLAIVSSTRWIKSWKDYRPLLQADITGAVVAEEHYVFTESKCFQEEEHGGLMYFLRISDDKSLVLFDYESQDLGIQGDDRLHSNLKPRQNLVIVHAPRSRFVISTTFSGELLEPGYLLTLDIDPKEWPEPESVCNIPWSELEHRFGPNKGQTAKYNA